MTLEAVPQSTTGAPAAVTAPVRYRWQLLRAGPLRLDGGSMFGVVPRALWSRLTPPDEEGRIRLAHNCLLLQPANKDEGGRMKDERAQDRAPSSFSLDPSSLLIETGSGDKFDAKMRRIFGLSEYSITDALLEADCRPDDLRHVIVSHLHFDHAGGLARRAREGETPDWRPAKEPNAAGVMRTFSNAEVIVQRREWEDAIANNAVMTRTYLRENLEPIREQLRLIDSPRPFPPGYWPAKDEPPPQPLAARATLVLPGIDVFLIPGHTRGQQAIRFADDRGRTVVFTADILPTIHHGGAAYNMAYDVEPYLSTVNRRWLLEEAARGDWLLVLDHEPDTPCVRVRADGKGWFKLVPEDAP
jgi:glyoxylase-like metal-dependent hydrolase (beta-lactamase superfamily II)